MKEKEQLMRRAIELSIQNIKEGGGPFGAVIVKDGTIISEGVNRVTANHDPTAHAEVNAIREACRKLGTFSLEGCEIYSSCEPCPMCLSAIYWAHLDKVYYAGAKEDAKAAGFDDAHIYEELSLPASKRDCPSEELLRQEAVKAFNAWKESNEKVNY